MLNVSKSWRMGIRSDLHHRTLNGVGKTFPVYRNSSSLAASIWKCRWVGVWGRGVGVGLGDLQVIFYQQYQPWGVIWSCLPWMSSRKKQSGGDMWLNVLPSTLSSAVGGGRVGHPRLTTYLIKQYKRGVSLIPVRRRAAAPYDFTLQCNLCSVKCTGHRLMHQ